MLKIICCHQYVDVRRSSRGLRIKMDFRSSAREVCDSKMWIRLFFHVSLGSKSSSNWFLDGSSFSYLEDFFNFIG